MSATEAQPKVDSKTTEDPKQPDTSSAPKQPPRPKCDLINRETRIGVQDGRYFTGYLVCFDGQCNCVLQNCMEHKEYVSSSNGSKTVVKRMVALMTVPGKFITSFHQKPLPKEEAPKAESK